MSICADCLKAETRLWSVYTIANPCCIARMVMEATPKTGAGQTLQDVRRRMCESVQWHTPELWPAVRARLDVLLEREREGATA